MKQLPQEFENRMKTLLGDEFEDFKKSFNEPPVRAFRVNTDKISLEDFEKINPFGGEKIPYVPNGFYFDYEKLVPGPLVRTQEALFEVLRREYDFTSYQEKQEVFYQRFAADDDGNAAIEAVNLLANHL